MIVVMDSRFHGYDRERWIPAFDYEAPALMGAQGAQEGGKPFLSFPRGAIGRFTARNRGSKRESNKNKRKPLVTPARV
jgi:hypothetical protein